MLLDSRHTRFRRVLMYDKLGTSEFSWAGPIRMPWAQLVLDGGEQVTQDMAQSLLLGAIIWV